MSSSSSSSSPPPNESLTQDFIAWDESRNLDLRQIIGEAATPAPEEESFLEQFEEPSPLSDHKTPRLKNTRKRPREPPKLQVFATVETPSPAITNNNNTNKTDDGLAFLKSLQSKMGSSSPQCFTPPPPHQNSTKPKKQEGTKKKVIQLPENVTNASNQASSLRSGRGLKNNKNPLGRPSRQPLKEANPYRKTSAPNKSPPLRAPVVTKTPEEEFGGLDIDFETMQRLTGPSPQQAPPPKDEFGDWNIDLAAVDRLTESSSPAAAAKPQDDIFGDLDMDSLTAVNRPESTSALPETETCNVVPVQQPPPQDEFGADFSLDEIDQLESVAAVKMPPPQPKLDHRKSSRRSDEFGNLDMSFDDLDAIDSMVQQASSTTKNARGQSKPSFEKGEFPEIDFEALDKAVADAEHRENVRHDLQQLAGPHPAAPPPLHSPVHNPRSHQSDGTIRYLSFSRYKVVQMQDDARTFTKTLSLASWNPAMIVAGTARTHWHRRGATPLVEHDWPVAGYLHLRGEWYHTRVNNGDIIHICSIQGEFRTDVLPLVLNTAPPAGSTEDDLVLIVHPDMLLTPTGISETLSCSRRAVIKSRLGSSRLTNKAPLLGTLRHELFEYLMSTRDFTESCARDHLRKIVRNHAEDILACEATTRECENEVLKFLPQLQRFVSTFTAFGSRNKSPGGQPLPMLENEGLNPSFGLLVSSIEAIEEPIVSPELGLKGNVDMIVNAMTESIAGTVETVLGVELKTGHNQKTQKTHMAQLVLYCLMISAKYGSKSDPTISMTAADSNSMLLYMNGDGFRAVHISPSLGDIKSLVGQRNILAIENRRAAMPRDVMLSYESSGESTGTRSPTIHLSDRVMTSTALPDLLPNDHTCNKCYANKECMMFERSAVSADKRNVHTHRKLLDKFTSQLTETDLDYFRKWDRLIDLEVDADNRSVTEAWLQSSLDREISTGRCISQVQFLSSSRIGEMNGPRKCILEFGRDTTVRNSTPMNSLAFEKGCHVVVSLDCTSIGPPHVMVGNRKMKRQLHVLRGYLQSISETTVSVLVSEEDVARLHRLVGSSVDLVKDHLGHVFRLDREDTAAGVGTLRQNLIKLFTADADVEELHRDVTFRRRITQLRDIIVRLAIPKVRVEPAKSLFTTSITMKTSSAGSRLQDLSAEFEAMNSDQKLAVENIFSAESFSLIQGLPGTGKTSTIAFVVRLLVARGKRVLISSYTHTAVDNVLLKLIDSGMGSNPSAMVRISQKSSCHPKIHEFLADHLASRQEERPSMRPSAESLKSVVSSAMVIGVSALSAPRSPLLVGQQFDVVIVDEAGQITQPAVLGPLMAADRFVLVGDHMQLPPLVASQLAEEGGYGESLLKRLADAHPTAISKLTFQYRMHEDICQLSNDIVYGGSLKCGNESTRLRKIELSGFPENAGPQDWIKETIDPNRAVVFVDTDSVRDAKAPVNKCFLPLEQKQGDRSTGSIVNSTEAEVVHQVIHGFLKCGGRHSDIGILCPFRAQLQLLHEDTDVKQWKTEGLEISTIDRYQGRDKPVIVLSFVRSNATGRVGRLLEDFRRLNVAITRAKCKLIMIGSFQTLMKGSAVLRPVLNRVVERDQVVRIPSKPFAPDS